MKHGPIALIDEKHAGGGASRRASRTCAYEKIVGNIEEVRARGGKVIAVVDEDDTHVAALADDVIRHPGGARRCSAPIVTDGAAAAARLPRGGSARDRRGSAAQPREERHGGVTAALRVIPSRSTSSA